MDKKIIIDKLYINNTISLRINYISISQFHLIITEAFFPNKIILSMYDLSLEKKNTHFENLVTNLKILLKQYIVRTCERYIKYIILPTCYELVKGT